MQFLRIGSLVEAVLTRVGAGQVCHLLEKHCMEGCLSGFDVPVNKS
jgi:hypothetical protein